ncbi:hypothetical protein [Sedimentibacter sp.]|nr:hypothetical protein [Sedimentibacter sp.]
MSLILLGCNQKENQENNDAIEISEKDSAERMSEQNYQFKNSTADHVFYYDDVIVYLDINEDDDYESVISKLGTPYYDNSESSPPSVVYLRMYKTYAEIFFNEETGKVSYISCFKE